MLTTFQQIGYRGVLSIEHEPPRHNPTDLRVSVQRVQGWLAADLAPSPPRCGPGRQPGARLLPPMTRPIARSKRSATVGAS